MEVQVRIPLLEDILGAWKQKIGDDYPAYRNHVYRMVHFCFALRDCDAEDRQKLIIAGCFHDLGIWSDGTVDYLPPSVVRARAYLVENGLAAWISEIELMIDQHHKLRKYRGGESPLIEVFRQADLIDLSLGLVKFQVPKSHIADVRQQFPNVGFHKRLLRLASEWFSEHPVSVPPFLKW